MGKKKPTHEIRLGSIRATIWPNKSNDGESWFSVTVTRLYKSNGDWKDAVSFQRDQLPVVAKALDMAYAWIWRQALAAERAKQAQLAMARRNEQPRGVLNN